MEVNGKHNSFLNDESDLKEMQEYLQKEPWVLPLLADFPNGDSWCTWETTETIVKGFLREYWLIDFEDITPKVLREFYEAIIFADSKKQS